MKFDATTPFHSSYDSKIEHYRVRKNADNLVTVDDEEYFENLFKLVEVSGHYLELYPSPTCTCTCVYMYM